MRDRRNTSLSVSSTEAANWATARSWESSLNEKRPLSPPCASPYLPLPVTKENRPKGLSSRTIAMRLLLAICGLVVLGRYTIKCGLFLPWTAEGMDQTDVDAELIRADDLPSEPTALMVLGHDHQSRWTISVPDDRSFPLDSHLYHDMCVNADGLRETIIRDSPFTSKSRYLLRQGYYTKDQTFLDVPDAEQAGLLPPGTRDSAPNVCESSMTFVLDSNEASFGKTLLLLWLSYGLAKHEGRAFFVDDSRWAWGEYTNYFAPIPEPQCSPPPARHIVPCPHSARHLAVSSATAPWTFGPAFRQQFSKGHKLGARNRVSVFDMLKAGYKDLFRLTGEDLLYATARVAKLKDDAASEGVPMIGMQIRRGDRHPFELQYSRDYLPLERYVEGAKSFVRAQIPGTRPSLIVASDDPDMLSSPEMQEAASSFSIQHAQERIQLATKTALDQTSPAIPLREPGSAYVKHVEENSGWEGGFYEGLFFGIGGGKRSATADPIHSTAIPEHTHRLRELVGRAYLLDLAVLAESDAVVCAVSSASCRILAVMMHGDAVADRRWKNIDDGRSWSWNGQR